MRKTILVTGGSGVVGQALLEQLTEERVICLTRHRPIMHQNDQQSVTTVSGDIRHPRLGLHEAQYQALARQADWVIHAAANTDFTRPLQELRECNVAGARHMATFARAANAPLIHVSTAFVQARNGHKINHYERSKREAEAVVRQSGVPATIVRPSIIIGDSQSGVIGKQQGIHRMIRLLLTGILPAVPGSAASRIDFVPQDQVAAAIVGLLRQNSVGGEYWLTAGETALPLQDGLAILVERASRILERQIPMPKLVAPAVFERMLGQRVLSTLTAKHRQLVEESLGLFKYMTMGDPFVSSFGELQQQIGLAALPNPHATFGRNLEYIVRYNLGRDG